MTEKLKTVWVRIHGDKRLYLKLSDGSIVKKNGKLYIQPPMLMLSIWEKEKNVHFGLFPEEVSRLVHVLDELARTVYRAELRLQEKYSELSDKAKESRREEKVEVVEVEV